MRRFLFFLLFLTSPLFALENLPDDKVDTAGEVQIINNNFRQLDAGMVHNFGTETINGDKTFTGNIDFATITVDTVTATNSVYMATSSGSVGIGTTTPSTTLEINAGASGDTPDLLVNGGARSALELRTTTAGDSYTYLQLNQQTYDWEIGARNQNGDLYFNNKILSGESTAPLIITNAGNTALSGFTTLGSGNTGVKAKLLTGTTSSSATGSVTIAHGLTGAKMVAVMPTVLYTANGGVGPHHTTAAGYDFDFFWDATNVTIENVSGASILSKPINIVVVYIE